MGEVKLAAKAAFGDKVDFWMCYNDWKGRKLLPNKRDIKLQHAIRKKVTAEEVQKFHRSLVQRIGQFDLSFGGLYISNRSSGYAGTVYLTLNEGPTPGPFTFTKESYGGFSIKKK
jgi:hypothetical protein